MKTFLIPGILILSYIIGSRPFGWIIVKLSTGKDIRTVESGGTGGTNAMRAAGFWAGIGTAVLDLLKSAFAVWLARALVPGNTWLEVFSPLLVILGHNYSLFLIERDGNGRLRLRGGAGGAPSVGGSVGLWFPSVLIIVPMAGLIFYFVGYASIGTMSTAIISVLLFAIRAQFFGSPWEYVFYGILAELILIWALRPNIRRLLDGQERTVGWRARRWKDRS